MSYIQALTKLNSNLLMNFFKQSNILKIFITQVTTMNKKWNNTFNVLNLNLNVKKEILKQV